jgi:pyridoxamine 5'-phosphate oxidase family protein
MVFTELELTYLADQPLGRLATVQPNGQPQASPVGFAWNPALSVIDIAGYRMAATQKFRNLGTSALIALVVDDVVSFDPWTVRCLEIRGRAEALTNPEQSVMSLGDGAIIRVYPRRIISWGIDPDASSPRNVA